MTTPETGRAVPGRALAITYLVLANLFWAGNWIVGRGVRDDFPPLSLAFWRWVVASLVLLPIALPLLRGHGPTLRRHLGLLLTLAFMGMVAFPACAYLGLRTTTAINGVLLNSSIPLFTLVASWIALREASTPRQMVGMAISLLGIVVIVTRGNLAGLAALELHGGDLWILLGMPCWAIYTVLLRRRATGLDSLALLFVGSCLGALELAPLAAVEMVLVGPPTVTWSGIAGVLYVGTFVSAGSYLLWSKGVAALGANIAGFSSHLLPAFGTLAAIVILGEAFELYHLAGFALILVGVALSTMKR